MASVNFSVFLMYVIVLKPIWPQVIMTPANGWWPLMVRHKTFMVVKSHVPYKWALNFHNFYTKFERRKLFADSLLAWKVLRVKKNTLVVYITKIEITNIHHAHNTICYYQRGIRRGIDGAIVSPLAQDF